MCSSSFYENCKRSNSISKNAEHKISIVPRRLALPKYVTSTTSERPKYCSQSPVRTGFHCKSEEIQSSTVSDNNIHRSTVQTTSEFSVSISRQSRQNSVSNHDSEIRSSFGPGFPSFTRIDGVLYRGYTQYTSLYEASSIASPTFLETKYNEFGNQNPVYTSSDRSFELVVTGSEYKQGSITSELVQFSSCDNGCLENGLRRSHEQIDLSRNLVRQRETMSYQCLGDGSSNQSSDTVFATPVKSKCIDPLRQHDCGTIHKQTGGHKVGDPLLQSMGVVADSLETQCSIESSSCSWGQEYFGRSIVSEDNKVLGMDSERQYCTDNICSLGETNDRSVCFRGKSKTADILFLAPTSSGICYRCSVCTLEQDDCICLSSNLSDIEGVGAYETVSLSGNTDRPPVAAPALVHKSAPNVNSSTSEIAGASRSVVSTKNQNLSSKTSDIQSDGLAALDRNFKDSGFSKPARNLLMASRRAGTQSDYAVKFKKFNSWCSQREKDPYTASIVDCVEFLTFLFHEGLKYRTISGYRSMLSAVVRPVNNVPVGQHPHLIRLLKGVFVSRPPTISLVPEWNLTKVLDCLQKPPFEPLRKAKLKYVTFKTVFLVAISTFRRCADIQALRLGEGWVNVQNRWITFLRPGLSKQDRPGHMGSKIFVPSFKKNKKLDPKRALYVYLKKTDKFRTRTDGEDITNLFLSYVQPHNAVSTRTISRWLVETIRLAYDDQKLKVRGHSTRAIGPSWALFNGAPLKAILEAADWSRESTFTKFYLRNVDLCVLDA